MVRWSVLSDDEAMEFPESQLYVDQAQEKNADIQAGDLLETTGSSLRETMIFILAFTQMEWDCGEREEIFLPLGVQFRHHPAIVALR